MQAKLNGQNQDLPQFKAVFLLFADKKHKYLWKEIE